MSTRPYWLESFEIGIAYESSVQQVAGGALQPIADDLQSIDRDVLFAKFDPVHGRLVYSELSGKLLLSQFTSTCANIVRKIFPKVWHTHRVPQQVMRMCIKCTYALEISALRRIAISDRNNSSRAPAPWASAEDTIMRWPAPAVSNASAVLYRTRSLSFDPQARCGKLIRLQDYPIGHLHDNAVGRKPPAMYRLSYSAAVFRFC